MKAASINWQVSIRNVTHRRKEALHGVWTLAVDRPQGSHDTEIPGDSAHHGATIGHWSAGGVG
jgi:hypothetical protein